VVRATRLALAYRNKFRKDVFVELHCFRRWGHNELDDPTFTNPKLYAQIHSRRWGRIQSGLPDGAYIFKPKRPILVYFGRPWKILFGMNYSHLVYFISILVYSVVIVNFFVVFSVYLHSFGMLRLEKIWQPCIK
jgi:hypothetical protein